ncbi:hypothetical protein PIB30_051707 [Stylosanthes scabra]|uniref:Senescence regulator S40 n=1 Tax=Stylosanthes scabra TaxID=79078 RepID=A0ABU6YJ53_9FABA|nr:hypothetical protein [Stylosanthes scabra]
MEGKYGVIREHSGIWKSLRDGDFDEEEVWSVLNKDTPDKYNHSGGALKIKGSSPIPVPKSSIKVTTSASRMIPRPNSTNNINNNNNNNNNTCSSEAKFQFLQQSAPVNIPDWSKIYNNSGDYVEDYGGGGSDEDLLDEDYDDYDVNNNNKMLLPPHELIARRLARSQISSFSVLEGVGRTLKGRDLSKVRNAVLTKTGFLESL